MEHENFANVYPYFFWWYQKLLDFCPRFRTGTANDFTMLNAIKKAFTTIALTFIPFSLLLAQEDMDFMRSMGKMYVVVAVIVAIVIGIVIYLISLDRKISKLENQIIDND